MEYNGESINKLPEDEQVNDIIPAVPTTYSIIQYVHKIYHNFIKKKNIIEEISADVICDVSFYPKNIVLYLALVSNYETYLYYKTRGSVELKTSYSIIINNNVNNKPKKYVRDDLEAMSESDDYEFCYDDLLFLMDGDISNGSYDIWKFWAQAHEKIKVKSKEFLEKYYIQITEKDAKFLNKYLFDHINLIKEINKINLEENKDWHMVKPYYDRLKSYSTDPMIKIYYDKTPYDHEGDKYDIYGNYSIYIKYNNYNVLYAYNCRLSKCGETDSINVTDYYCVLIRDKECNENIIDKIKNILYKLWHESYSHIKYYIPNEISTTKIKNKDFFEKLEKIYENCDIYNYKYENIIPKEKLKPSVWSILNKYLNMAKT